MWRAYRRGMPLGDVTVLKVDALAAVPLTITIADKLQQVRGYAPTQDLATLRALPEGSLGREYARFLDANGITPLVVSDAVRARFHDQPFALRYAMTHDLHHVLAGFDTTLAGEAGVLAFNVGQGAAPVGRSMLPIVRALYSLASPRQARAIGRNVRVGFEAGRRADLVMAAPIESYFEQPIDDVRRRLRIQPLGVHV
jgi:ubiquinone biosynthesis protein Coq4